MKNMTLVVVAIFIFIFSSSSYGKELKEMEIYTAKAGENITIKQGDWSSTFSFVFGGEYGQDYLIADGEKIRMSIPNVCLNNRWVSLTLLPNRAQKTIKMRLQHTNGGKCTPQPL